MTAGLIVFHFLKECPCYEFYLYWWTFGLLVKL